MKHTSPMLETLWAEPRERTRYEAFVDLISRAARREKGVRVARAVVTVQRGELLVSERDLADRWQWSQRKVRAFLDYQRKSGEILSARVSRTATGKGIKLTLVNYDTYAKLRLKPNQDEAQAKSKRSREMRGAAEQRATQEPPQTPPVVKTPLCLERSLPLRGSGGGVADARDVDNPVDNLPDPQLELPPPVAPINPEHLRYAEALAAALNEGQAGNGLVDRDTYRPLAAHHPKTLLAALAIKNAGVPLLYAATYARTQGAQYKPKRTSQIHSAAYVQGGCIRAWRELHERQHEKQHRRRVPVQEEHSRGRSPSPVRVNELVEKELERLQTVRS